jgi:hypothetical protein
MCKNTEGKIKSYLAQNLLRIALKMQSFCFRIWNRHIVFNLTLVLFYIGLSLLAAAIFFFNGEDFRKRFSFRLLSESSCTYREFDKSVHSAQQKQNGNLWC